MKSLTKLLIALLAISLCLNGCKKSDTIVNPNQTTNKQMIEQFTKVPKGLNPELQKIANKLKEKDSQTPFIVKVGSRAGVPLWSKAQFKLKHTNNAAAREMLEGEQTVLIPLSVASSSEVDGFIAAIIDANGDVKSVSEYDKFNYYSLGFNKPDTEKDAEDVAMQILILQKEVFGNAKFIVLDNKLFNAQDGSSTIKKIFEISLSETQPTSQTNSRVILVKYNHCIHHDANIIGPNGHAGGDCDECDWCGLFNYIVLFFDSPQDWGGGGGIGGGDTGGGGGVFGGAGWSPSPPAPMTVNNIWQNIGLTPTQKSFTNDFNNKPFLNEIAGFMQDESFSSEAITAAKAVLNAYMNNKINGPYDINHFNDLVYDMPSTSIAAGATAYFDKFNSEKAIYNSYNTGWSDAKSYFYSTFMTNRWLSHLWHQSPWELFNKIEMSYLLSHPSIKDEIDYFMTSKIDNYDYSPESVIASRATTKALISNSINGSYNQQFFDDNVKLFLSSEVESKTSATAYNADFIHQKDILSFANPSMSDVLLFAQAFMNTNQMYFYDATEAIPTAPYDPSYFDNTVYAPYDFTQPPTPPIPNVIPKTQFVPHRKVWSPSKNKMVDVNCMTLCKEQIAKAGCILTKGYDPGGETFRIRWNPTYKPSKDDEQNNPGEQYDETEAKKAFTYIKESLKKGIPVIAGVNTRGGEKPDDNKDNVTNHFIVIVGYGIDSKGRECFRFYDNGTANNSEGTKDELTLVFISGKGIVAGWGTSSNPNYDEHYQITQIRKCAKK